MKHPDLLIVDDEQRYADMLSRRLSLRGLSCMVRYDAKTALDLITEAHIPVVLLDLRLPDLYGTEVLSEIKKHRPDTVVIIITGHGTEKDREECMAKGAHAFMNKPLDIHRLVAIMDRSSERSG
jgi:DNA-binding NtrC family response regulator